MPSPLARVLSAVCCALLVSACGSGEATSPQTRTALQERVSALVSAVNAKDYAMARMSLDALRADIESAQRLGALAEGRAMELTRLANGVQAGLPATPSPAATKGPVTRPSPQAPAVGTPPVEKSGKDKDDDDHEDD